MHIHPNLLHLQWRLYLEERARWSSMLKDSHSGEILPAAGLNFDRIHENLSHPHWEIRCAAAKNLGLVEHESAGEALVVLLQDCNLSVRWAAIETLSCMRRAAIKPLLSALTRHYDSPALRASAHHVMANLHAGGHLKNEEISVLHCLEHGHSPFEIARTANLALISEIGA